MLILVLSHSEAISHAAAAQKATAIISITSTDEEDVAFPENASIAAVLRLRFNDLTQPFDDEGIPYGRPLPKAEDFIELKAFVEGLSCQCLIVHCWEGASRSAAVAKAIYEFRGSTDTLKPGRRFAPNPLVYALASWALRA